MLKLHIQAEIEPNQKIPANEDKQRGAFTPASKGGRVIKGIEGGSIIIRSITVRRDDTGAQ